MALEVHPLDPIGAEIRGADLRRDVDPDVFDELEAALLAHGVLVLRDQFIDVEDQVVLGERFGPLESRSFDDHAPHPKVIVISNVGRDGHVLPRTSENMQMIAINETWHTDSSFRETPASVSLFSAQVVPEIGGDTFYASMRRGWLDLDEPGRAELYGLRALHDYTEAYRRIGSRADDLAKTQLPPMSHPIARVHPETGEPCLFVTGHAFRVEGLVEDAGSALLERLLSWCTRDEVVYRHKWRAGDFVLWDNRCMLHRAEGFDETNPRVMYHVRVGSSKPVVAAEP